MDSSDIYKFRYAALGLAAGIVALNLFVMNMKVSQNFKDLEIRLTVIETNMNVPNYKDLLNNNKPLMVSRA